MHKRIHSDLRTLLYSVLCSFLILSTGACNQTPDNPVVPTATNPPATTATTAPVTTETPQATEVPTTTKVPEATTVPAPTEEPVVSSAPVATEAPAITEVPAITDIPAPTATPTTTEAPAVPESPVSTVTPIATATPVLTVTPVPTATPVPTIIPSPTEAPTPTPLPVPTFSKDGGFYDTSFNLSLSSDTGTKIYYTKDGSDPRTSDTATPYTSTIYIYDNTDSANVYSALTDITLTGYWPPQFNVDKGIVIRAVAKTTEGEYGDVISNSYFVGKTASYYKDLKVISMVTDEDYLFDPDTGAYMIGSKYYAWKNSSDYVAYDPGDVQNPTNYNSDGKESEFPVSIQVFEKGSAMYSADVGARISGNWSRSAAQKSIRFYARKEYGTKKMKYAFFDDLTDANGKLIKKFDKITLRNGGNDHQALHFRDPLIQELAQGLAVDYMASEPYLLFINGEFWGFYMLREKPEDYYIQSHYGIDEKDVAVIKNGGLESGSEKDLGDYWDFCNWVASADMTQQKNYDKFCAQMDVQSFMDYVTVETYINNNDWAPGTYMNNWMVWRSNTVNPDLPKADGKWRFILYDTEFSTGLYGSEQTSYHYNSLQHISAGDSSYNIPAMLQSLCKNNNFRQAFYDNYIRIIDTNFAPKKVNAITDTYANAYGDAIKATFRRFGMDWAADNFENEVSNLRTFFEQRPDYAKRYLKDFYNSKSSAAGSSGNTTASATNMVPKTTKWTYYGDAAFFADTSDNSFRVSVPRSMQNTWDIQSQAPGLTLEYGCEYKLSFDASGSDATSLTIGCNRFDGSGYPTCFWKDTTLSKELKNYEFTFIMDNDTHSDWQLCFNFGTGRGDFVIKNVSLIKVK